MINAEYMTDTNIYCIYMPWCSWGEGKEVVPLAWAAKLMRKLIPEIKKMDFCAQQILLIIEPNNKEFYK
jgi:hypothetical protein